MFPLQFIGKVWSRDLAILSLRRQSEVLQIQFLNFEVVVKAFLPHFAAFFGLLLTELSPGLQRTF